jgi:hypothetical protein
MGCDTHGYIKGYVSDKDIADYISRKYQDAQVLNEVNCHKGSNIETLYSKIGEFCMNPKHENDERECMNYGFIRFQDGKDDRMIFYSYNNVNYFENAYYYCKDGLNDMVFSDKTYISLGLWGNSIEIIKDIIHHFGGGWIDENDCDDKTYEKVE